jgi:hypothetical protein
MNKAINPTIGMKRNSKTVEFICKLETLFDIIFIPEPSTPVSISDEVEKVPPTLIPTKYIQARTFL